MANVDSYHHRKEAGQWVSWVTQNRDVPLRKISPGHSEIRSADATTSPYLSLAASMSAGLHGVEIAQPLTWKDSQRWSAEYTAEELKARNITKEMPDSLSAALAELEEASKDSDLGLGNIIPQYIHLKREEIKRAKEWGPEGRRSIYSEYI